MRERKSSRKTNGITKANHIRQGEEGTINVCYGPQIHLPRKLRISQPSDLDVHFKADYEF